jgi:hypothetical protein
MQFQRRIGDGNQSGNKYIFSKEYTGGKFTRAGTTRDVFRPISCISDGISM